MSLRIAWWFWQIKDIRWDLLWLIKLVDELGDEHEIKWYENVFLIYKKIFN